MSNIIKFPVIAGVEITTDSEGRFNLNALHRASGLEKHKSPNKWLENQATKELIEELSGNSRLGQNTQTPNSGLGSNPVSVQRGGTNPGTFAHELLAVSYAGWISPAFQLKVNQVFIDYRTGRLEPAMPKSLPEALRLAAELAEEKERLQASAKAYERIAVSDGGMCISNAAKDLQINPKNLFKWLNANRWIYRRAGGGHWIAYQDKIQSGMLEHKVTTVSRSDGTEKTVEQVLVTPKGLTVLAQKMTGQVA